MYRKAKRKNILKTAVIAFLFYQFSANGRSHFTVAKCSEGFLGLPAQGRLPWLTLNKLAASLDHNCAAVSLTSCEFAAALDHNCAAVSLTSCELTAAPALARGLCCCQLWRVLKLTSGMFAFPFSLFLLPPSQMVIAIEISPGLKGHRIQQFLNAR